MTQRIFDIYNEKDYADLWDIVPDNAVKIKKSKESRYFDRLYRDNGDILVVCFLNINWHDKTEITRPIQEATEADIGKLCYFWNDKGEAFFGRLGHIGDKYFTMIAPVYEDIQFLHCRRLTKQEIEELC